MAKLVLWLKRAALWLEARFPVQCVVAKADYDKFIEEFETLKTDSARLDAVVKDIVVVAATLDVLKASLEALVKKQELMERRPGTPDSFNR